MTTDPTDRDRAVAAVRKWLKERELCKRLKRRFRFLRSPEYAAALRQGQAFDVAAAAIHALPERAVEFDGHRYAVAEDRRDPSMLGITVSKVELGSGRHGRPL